MLDHCNVQVDNPVSLLNQDTSRHFLQKNKPGDKYKLFMKATHLEQIATDYELAEQDQMIMRDGITRHEAVGARWLCEGVWHGADDGCSLCEGVWHGADDGCGLCEGVWHGADGGCGLDLTIIDFYPILVR